MTRTLRSMAAIFVSVLSLGLLSSSALAEPTRDELLAMGRTPEPPAMPHRSIAPSTTQPAGEQIEIVDGDYKTVLFVPAGYHVPADGHVNLTVHFHGGIWFPIQEHLRRGLAEPLLVCHFGEGSSTYGKPFLTDTDRFGRFVAAVEAELRKRPDGTSAKVTQVDLTSFSAGYGSVREIIKQDRYVALIRRIVLCDSLYAEWDQSTNPGATSQPAAVNMDPWKTFLRLAADGKKTFVLAHSHVPTPTTRSPFFSYANTAATAKWIAELVNAPRVEIAANSSPASSVADYPLVYRADIGHLHLWGYAGIDAQAHLTSVRHLAEIWQALDACGDR